MSKITIVNDKDESIVGIFENKTEFDIGRERPRIAIIAHGILGHKDYLFQRLLAERLPISSFRLDFRGNGESGGSPGYANIAEDAEDLETVANYFENEGYEIYAVIGHSRGGLAALKFATTCEKPLPILVNISARYKMNDFTLKSMRSEILDSIKEKGYFDWKVRQRDRIATVKVTYDEVEKFRNWSNEFISRMPLATSVLTCHGLNDAVVPPYNAAMYANKIPNHTLVLIPGADHNYTGKYKEVTDAVIRFFQKHEKDNYTRAISMGQGSGLVIPRWVDIGGAKNFRDIGGWPVKDGSGYIRERTVFRSAHLSNLTPHGRARLSELNVKAVFDFRLGYEFEKDGIMEPINGITRYSYSLYENAIKSLKDLHTNLMLYLEGPEGFAKAYMIILDSGKDLIGDVFRYMIKNLFVKERSAMVVHCTAGKDRTGVFIAVLLGLCGVDDEIIAREYNLSNVGYFEYEKNIDTIAKQVGIPVEDMRKALSASYEGIKITIEQLKQKYGSFERYVHEACGLTKEEIQAVRDLMIVPIKFEERQLYRSKL